MLEIGARYSEHLSVIKRAVIGLYNAGCKVNPEVKILSSSCGTCCYSSCWDKSVPVDCFVTLVYENGCEKCRREQKTFFHLVCLKNLLKDRRYPTGN